MIAGHEFCPHCGSDFARHDGDCPYYPNRLAQPTPQHDSAERYAQPSAPSPEWPCEHDATGPTYPTCGKCGVVLKAVPLPPAVRADSPSPEGAEPRTDALVALIEHLDETFSEDGPPWVYEAAEWIRAAIEREAALPDMRTPVEGDAGFCPTCQLRECIGRLQYEHCTHV